MSPEHKQLGYKSRLASQARDTVPSPVQVQQMLIASPNQMASIVIYSNMETKHENE